MTIQINVGDHASRVPQYIPIPHQYRGMVRWARAKAQHIARTNPRADFYFKGLPNRRSLSNLLGDRQLWINYLPGTGYFGWTQEFSDGSPPEIALDPPAFQMGRWSVLATLIHELAHVGGAPGGDGSFDRSAELAVLACGLGKQSEERRGRDDPLTPFDPTIRG